MPYIPAICRNCGLTYPSVFNFNVGTTFYRNQSPCPRCGTQTFALDGYGASIDGVVTFVQSSEETREQKELFFQVLDDLAKRKTTSRKAIEKVEKETNTGAPLLREILNTSAALVSAFAAVGAFLLAWHDERRNEPIEPLVAELVEEHIRELSQPDLRRFRPPPYTFRPVAVMPSKRPVSKPSTSDEKSKQGERNSASAKPLKENRKARRAAAKKRRAKTKKKRHHCSLSSDFSRKCLRFG